jgi:hemerythrin-like domain-containing protein
MTNEHTPKERDIALAEELEAHHAEMIRTLDGLSTALAHAASAGDGAEDVKHDLERWVADVLVPHAAEEEQTTYRAAGELPEGKLLITSMLAEHELIRLVARHMSEADDPVAAGAFARALFHTFDSHQRKENDIVLPLLMDADSVSLTDVMSSAHTPEHHRHGLSHDHVD